VGHVATHGQERVTRQIVTYDPLCALSSYAHETHTAEDFDQARSLFNALGRLSHNGTLRTAAQATMRALTEQGWTLRFLLLWLVLESLFGSEDPREVTFRLSQRIALFLSRDRGVARDLFSQIKASYAWRSKVVHGFRLAKLTPEKSDELIIQLEDIVRRSMVTMLSDESLVSVFDTESREDYLDGLIFR
jgi:hypothetical protein